MKLNLPQLTFDEMFSMRRNLENDLIAFYNVLKDDILKILENEENSIDDILKAIDDLFKTQNGD